MVRFAHLHCHSHYSLLEACTRIEDLCDAAVRAEQDRIALTDHGNLFGAIEFFQAAQKRGLTPIIGCELYVAARDHKERDPNQPVHHLTVLAESNEGYHNLIKLVTAGWLEGFYFTPRVDRELIANHSKGLIALSGCMSGEISRKVLAGDLDSGVRLVDEYREIFGRENFFLEVMENEIPLQRKQREGLLEIADRADVTAVLTNDVHYLESQTARAREVMMCIQSGKTLMDEKRRRLETDKHHFRTSEEMATLFKGADRLCENAYEVAERCNVEMQFDKFHLPHFEVPDGMEMTQYFKKVCRDGVLERYGAINTRIEERLDYEMEVIEEMGFVAYFLITADFMTYSRDNGIPVGPGRGSAAGSIVSYAMGITDVDPLKYDLLFERFLNRGRVSMPDIDIDFCRDKREQVMRYVQDKYGHANVCQIVTFGTLAAKAAIRDTGRVLGLELGLVDTVAKKIPTIPGTRLKDALEDEELTAMGESDARVKQLFEIALSIEGMNRHTSTHAAGVVITDKPLSEYVPLCRVQQEVNTQYSMNELESIGLLKMDFLGLKTLTVLARAEDLIRASGTEIDLESSTLDDPATYALLCKGSTTGVFQLESSGMRELLQKMQPDNFEDIVAILALYRPGPLGSGMVESFVNRKHGREEIEYPHPSLEPILKPTYGVMVYQEQIMRISNVLAGFKLEEADNLRKAMGKKKPEVMEKFKAKFIDGSVAKDVNRKVATDIWETMAFFAGYGFNKSHTVAYGILTYRTAYLKANHPREFMAACMSIDRGDTDKVAIYLDDCRVEEIPVLVPDLNESQLDFAIKDSSIRFGLGAIKGVGEKPVEAVLEARGRLGRPFRSLVEVFEEIDATHVSKSVWEAFVTGGAFDWTDMPRARVFGAIERLVRIGQRHQADRRAGQLSLFAAAVSAESDLRLPEVGEWPDREKLAREKDALGFFLTDHPLRSYSVTLARFATHGLTDLTELEDKTEVTIGGVVNAMRITVTKRGRSAGQKMALFRIAGLEGTPVQAVCFSEDYKKAQDALEDDAVCLFTGTIDTQREEPSMRVTMVEPVHEVLTRRVARVILTIDHDDESALGAIRECLGEHRGNVPVYLRFPEADDDRLVRCGSNFKISVSEESLDAMAMVVGRDNVICR